MDEKQKIAQDLESTAEKIKKVRIYTMPEKFYVDESRGSGGSNRFLIIGIIVVVVLILGAGAYLLINSMNQSLDNGNSLVITNDANTNTNQVNSNINGNTNGLNANTNLNSNSSTNINSIINNANLFTNANVNTNVATINTNTAVASGQDTDLDDLTDIEESLYGTNISLPDTDNDGFADGQELANGYDPNSTSRLENSSKVTAYNDTVYGYSIFYPAAWVTDNDPQSAGGKIFTSGEEFVSLTIQDNPALLSARDWYITKLPSIDSSQIVGVTNWDKTLTGVKSVDGLTVYYTNRDKVYVINYSINLLSEANYQTTFEMMYKSFKMGAVTTTPTNQNINSVINLNSLFSNSNSNTNTNTNLNTNTNINSNTNTNTNSNTNNSNRF